MTGKAPLPPIGHRFNRLTVLGGVHEAGAWLWECRCDCGTVIRTRPAAVKSGHAKSCGCLQREAVATKNLRHGRARDYIYVAWQGMHQRCGNPKNAGYLNYGARGIAVCEAWHSFDEFARDMGERPTPQHSIDRIDNDRGYSPENCRWATPTEQVGNRRLSHANRTRKIIPERLDPMTFDLGAIRATLIELRVKHSEYPVLTHRFSDAVSLLENEHRARLAGDLVRADKLHGRAVAKLAEVEQIQRDGKRFVPAHHFAKGGSFSSHHGNTEFRAGDQRTTEGC